MDSSLKNPNPNPLYYLQPPHQNYNHHHNFLPKPTFNQPYYLQPPPVPFYVGYASPYVGYMEKPRIVNPLLNSRFKDGFSNLEYARNGFGNIRVDESYREPSRNVVGNGRRPERLKDDYYYSEIERYLDNKDKCVETSKDDYYLSEIERYFDHGKIKEGSSDEVTRTTNDGKTKYSSSSDDMNGPTNESQHEAELSEKRVKSFKLKRKETRCISGNVLLGEVAKNKETFIEKNLSKCSDNTSVVSQAKSRNFSQSPQACDSSVETVSRKETMETTPVDSIAEVGSDAGKYTCLNGISSSPKNVAGNGSSNVQTVERTYVEQHLSLSKYTNVDASECQFNLQDKEKSLTCNSLPVLETENSAAIGNMDSSRSETQPGNKGLPDDPYGCGSSDVSSSMDKDLVEDPLRISSRMVPDSSVNPCHLSPFVSASSSVEENRSSHCGLVEKEKDVDVQKENVKPTGKISQCGTSGTGFVTVSRDSQSKKTLRSIIEKPQKRVSKHMHAPRSLSDTKKDANPPMNVAKHHTWHRKSDTSASPLVAANPKVTVQSSGSFVRIGNSLIRKPSPCSLGEPQTLQRHSRAPSGRCALFSSDFPLNGLTSSDTLAQTGFASDCQPKQNLTKLVSLNPGKMLYGKRKANQLVEASDIHGVSGGYFKRSKNQLVRNSEYLVNQEKSLSDDSLDSGEKMVSKNSSSLALPEYAVMRPFNQSNCSLAWTLKELLSRKANRVHRNPRKIVAQPVPCKRGTYRRRLENPALVPRNGSFSTISRKFPTMRKRHTVYRRSNLKWSNSVERHSKKPEFLSEVESWRSGHSECGKNTKKSSTLRRLATGNDKSVWIRNGNRLVGDPKKQTRVLANEKVRWSLHNVRLRPAKKRNYCQFFTRFGKCNKDDGKCPYIHDPSKVAVCTKFVSSSCANPDCKLTHKVVPERMPDCSYYLQGLCNNQPCLYRHVHVNQNAGICEGFLRGYCSDGNECRKKHTYTCPVFEATGICPQESECKLHHPKNRSKGTKRKRANEPQQEKSCGRYFGSMYKDLPEFEPMLINKLVDDTAVLGREGLDFIQLDATNQEESENMDSSTKESVSEDSEARDLIDELIRPVGLMHK